MAGTFEYIGTSIDTVHGGVDVYARPDLVHSTGDLIAMIYNCKGENARWRGKVILTDY